MNKRLTNAINYWHNNRGTYFIALAWLGGMAMGIALFLFILGFPRVATLAMAAGIALTACAWAEGRALDKYVEENERPERFLNSPPKTPVNPRPAMSYWDPNINQFKTITR